MYRTLVVCFVCYGSVSAPEIILTHFILYHTDTLLQDSSRRQSRRLPLDSQVCQDSAVGRTIQDTLGL